MTGSEEKKKENWREICFEDCEKPRHVMNVARACIVALPKCLIELGIVKPGSLIRIYIDDIDFEKKEVKMRLVVLKE